jgi:hypothetical protein
LELEGLLLLMSASGFPLFILILVVCDHPILFVGASIVFVLVWAAIVRKSKRVRIQEEETG